MNVVTPRPEPSVAKVGATLGEPETTARGEAPAMRAGGSVSPPRAGAGAAYIATGGSSADPALPLSGSAWNRSDDPRWPPTPCTARSPRLRWARGWPAIRSVVRPRRAGRKNPAGRAPRGGRRPELVAPPPQPWAHLVGQPRPPCCAGSGRRTGSPGLLLSAAHAGTAPVLEHRRVAERASRRAPKGSRRPRPDRRRAARASCVEGCGGGRAAA